MVESFEAIIKSDRITYIEIPFNASEKFKKKGKILVKGIINSNYPYKKSLLSRGNGKYILTLNKSDCKRMGVTVGDKLLVLMELYDNLTENDINQKEHEDIIGHYKSFKEKKKVKETINVFEAIFTRRSVRNFTGEIIKESDLETMIKAGCYAPSAENKQPWHFVILRDQFLLEAIAKFHPRAKMLPKAGCGIVVCGDKEIQSQVGFLVEDCSAAIENMLLSAHGLGLGSVWCGLYPATQFTKPIKKLLKLPPQILPIGMIAVGYIDEEKDIVYRYDKTKIHMEKW